MCPHVDSREFGRWYEAVRINGFVDFVHCPEFQITRKQSILETVFFPPSGEERETTSLLGTLERANLNHWLMGKDHKPSDSKFSPSNYSKVRKVKLSLCLTN
jgi:hypothetical protein